MTHNKRLFFIHLIIILMLCPSFAFAQKKEIKVARENIKNGKDLDKAETSMRTLLKDSANRYNEKIWLTLFDAVKKQYEQLNEKLYLKQESDTAKFFTHTRHMFTVLESLDSVDARPNKKGVVSPVYRRSHSIYLNQYRKNLFSGGAYYMQKQDYLNAWKCFDTYLQCDAQPLFSEYNYSISDKRLPEAGYWALFCGYKLGDVARMDKYADVALRDSLHESYTLQYIAEGYKMKGDTANYRVTLEEGFRKYPAHAYYFPHLAICYSALGRNKDVLDISEKALTLNPSNVAALISESATYLTLSDFDKCIEVSDKAIALNPTKSVCYLNAGIAYYYKARPYVDKKIPTNKDLAEIKELYKRALPYLEKYRKMVPEDKGTWAQPLYDIYLNLNMGDEFEEMEDILGQ